MAIRIRKVDGVIITICANLSDPKEGDIYLDDSVHHALSTKFGLDWESEGFMEHSLADKRLIPLMKKEQYGRVT